MTKLRNHDGMFEHWCPGCNRKHHIRKNKWAGTYVHGTVRVDDNLRKPMTNNKKISEYGQRFNVWEVPPQRQRGDGRHPAPFPYAIAADHIRSWSNPGDLVLDPFLGSGTTAVAAQDLGRRFIGVEINDRYLAAAKKRLYGQRE